MRKYGSLLAGVEVYQGPCESLMSLFDDIDLVFADPPYNIGKNYDGYDDEMSHDDYMEWTKKWIIAAKDMSKGVFIYPPKIHLREFWNLIPENHLIVCGYSPAGAIRGSYIHQYVPLLAPPNPRIKIPDHWWNIQLPALGYFYHEEKYDHPGQTSLEVTMKAIAAFTGVGDTVLDPFGGTGTTAEACIRLDRRCILIEQSEKYVDIAINRIKKTLMQPRLI